MILYDIFVMIKVGCLINWYNQILVGWKIYTVVKKFYYQSCSPLCLVAWKTDKLHRLLEKVSVYCDVRGFFLSTLDIKLKYICYDLFHKPDLCYLQWYMYWDLQSLHVSNLKRTLTLWGNSLNTTTGHLHQFSFILFPPFLYYHSPRSIAFFAKIEFGNEQGYNILCIICPRCSKRCS